MRAEPPRRRGLEGLMVLGGEEALPDVVSLSRGMYASREFLCRKASVNIRLQSPPVAIDVAFA